MLFSSCVFPFPFHIFTHLMCYCMLIKAYYFLFSCVYSFLFLTFACLCVAVCSSRFIISHPRASSPSLSPALFFPAIFCIATAYSGCSATLTVLFLCLANFTNGGIGSSILVNYTDIAPNFSGKAQVNANTRSIFSFTGFGRFVSGDA